VQEAIASQDGPMEDFYALRTEFKSALAALVKVLQSSENSSASAAFKSNRSADNHKLLTWLCSG
jgi:hypothetical protein